MVHVILELNPAMPLAIPRKSRWQAQRPYRNADEADQLCWTRYYRELSTAKTKRPTSNKNDGFRIHFDDLSNSWRRADCLDRFIQKVSERANGFCGRSCTGVWNTALSSPAVSALRRPEARLRQLLRYFESKWSRCRLVSC